MILNRSKKRNIRLGLMPIIILVFGCNGAKRDFFQGMKESFKDVRVDSTFYFVKSFGFSKKATSINGVDYWQLKNSKDSYFKLSGYLRNLKDSIAIIPKDNRQSKEQKIFDFKNKIGSQWKVIYSHRDNSFVGDSIVYLNRTILNSDTLYTYDMHPFMFIGATKRYEYRGPVFRLEVSKQNGIVSIAKLTGDGHAASFKATLYPKQSFKILIPRQYDL